VCGAAGSDGFAVAAGDADEGLHVDEVLRPVRLQPVAELAGGRRIAGGLWELPVNVRAFLDTIAFAEGTLEHYNYIYTFVPFSSYTDHPRKRACNGGLCSTAAGRYQFLSKTWDALAKEIDLPDFTPPNQEKAVLEILRRSGVYTAVENSAKYENFSKAITKINNIWASLPDSPYGQPTYPMSTLWAVYKASLAAHKAMPPALHAHAPQPQGFYELPCFKPVF